jgi:hypothetical protein
MTADSTSAEVNTGPFGKVPKERIDRVTLDGLYEMKQQIFQMSIRAANSGRLGELASNEEFLTILDHFRTDVGALWLRLKRQLDDDIGKAYQISDSFWKCMWVSLVRNQLKPQKYYATCGTPSRGYNALVMNLANLPAREQWLQRWGCGSWKEYGRAVLTTGNQLAEKEKEYRDTAIAIAQIGVGVGGMLLGILGLGLSLIFSLLPRSP